jgi:hypothetical protein
MLQDAVKAHGIAMTRTALKLISATAASASGKAHHFKRSVLGSDSRIVQSIAGLNRTKTAPKQPIPDNSLRTSPSRAVQLRP